MAGLLYHVKFPSDPLPAPMPKFFPTMGRGADPGQRGGGGTPHLPRHMGGGVIPSEKISGGGVGGSPPSPLCPRNDAFSARPNPVFRVEPRRNYKSDEVTIFGWGGQFGPDGGGGTPHLLRYMGGGVIPSRKINGGGVGGPPPSPLVHMGLGRLRYFRIKRRGQCLSPRPAPVLCDNVRITCSGVSLYRECNRRTRADAAAIGTPNVVLNRMI
jgi:hypothetical protein